MKLINDSITDFLGAWPRLLTTLVIYKIVAVVVFTPIVGFALKFFLWTRGQSVVADQDIVYFLVSPVGLTSVVVIGAVSLAILSLEQACLMAIGFGKNRGIHVGIIDALWYTTRHVGSVAGLALQVFVRLLLVALPFLAASVLVSLLFLGEYDINYYLAGRPPVFLFATGIISILLIGMAILILRRLLGWTFALPLLLFEGLSPAAALTTSAERIAGHRLTVGFRLGAWGVSAVILSAAPPAIVGVLGHWIVPPFADSMVLLLIVMGAFLLLWGLLNLGVVVINESLLALMIVRLYSALGSSSDARLSGTSSAMNWASESQRRISIKWAIGAVVLAGVLAAVAGFLFVDTVQLEDEVLVIAHRGAAGSAPENTLASVSLAIEQGADMVEIDVQETSDGEVVVIHDSDLMRVGGQPMKVWDATYEEILEIDVGSWYGSDFSDQRVPTLEQVLELCRGRVVVDIELKDYGRNKNLEEKVAFIVERMEMENDVVLMSLAPAIVSSMKALRPQWTVGLLTAKAVGDLTTSDADFLAVHLGMANSGFIHRAHASGKDIYVWTVNDRINMSRLMSRGADGIITDRPALARQVIETRSEMSSAERLILSASFWVGLEPKEPPAETDLN